MVASLAAYGGFAFRTSSDRRRTLPLSVCWPDASAAMPSSCKLVVRRAAEPLVPAPLGRTAFCVTVIHKFSVNNRENRSRWSLFPSVRPAGGGERSACAVWFGSNLLRFAPAGLYFRPFRCASLLSRGNFCKSSLWTPSKTFLLRCRAENTVPHPLVACSLFTPYGKAPAYNRPKPSGREADRRRQSHIQTERFYHTRLQSARRPNPEDQSRRGRK